MSTIGHFVKLCNLSLSHLTTVFQWKLQKLYRMFHGSSTVLEKVVKGVIWTRKYVQVYFHYIRHHFRLKIVCVEVTFIL